MQQIPERDRLITDLFPDGLGDGRVGGRLLRTREVALLFEVSERTVTEWAARGRIPSVRTPGGHRRYPADGVAALLALSEAPATGDAVASG